MLIASSSSRRSGLRSSTGPLLTSPPATFTTTSSPPKRSRAAATARRAAPGVVRSPAAAWTEKPSAVNSFARSASPAALTSAMTSCAPARPNPRATAWPIWPTRPTPVTSATLPRKSGGMRDDLVHGRGAALCEGDGAIPLHHVHRALDALAVVFQRAVGAGDRAVGVREQRKIEAKLLDVARVTLHTGGVDAEGLDARFLELGHLVAHGGELTVSARGVVAGIEHQRDLFRLQDIGQAVGLAIRRGGGERGCLAADGQELGHVIVLRFWGTVSRDIVARRSSSFSSQSSGISSPPSGAWESPSSMSPCQSEPPLIARPRRCAIPVSRRSAPGEWLGCRTSRPSRPCSWNCRICPSVPWSPRWAATAIPPTACTRSATCCSVGNGFST